MKRTAADAGLPEAPHLVRVDVRLPQEPWGQSMSFQLQCRSIDNIDQVKRALQHQVWQSIGWCPRLSAYQLQQDGKHTPFTQPISALNPLLPVLCIRTA